MTLSPFFTLPKITPLARVLLITRSSLIKSWKNHPGCVQYRDILYLSPGKPRSYTTHKVKRPLVSFITSALQLSLGLPLAGQNAIVVFVENWLLCLFTEYQWGRLDSKTVPVGRTFDYVHHRRQQQRSIRTLTVTVLHSSLSRVQQVHTTSKPCSDILKSMTQNMK